MEHQYGQLNGGQQDFAGVNLAKPLVGDRSIGRADPPLCLIPYRKTRKRIHFTPYSEWSLL